MNILVVSPEYPDKYRPKYQFVKELVMALSKCGHTCYVIAPYSVTKNRHLYQTVMRESQNVVVCRPPFLSFSKLKIGNLSLSYHFRKRALYRALSKMDFTPDVIYAHFWMSAEWISDYAREKHLPLFVASGESDISHMIDLKRFSKDISNLVSGVVCVSTKNLEESVSCGLTSHEKCKVIPNAVDKSLFCPMDRLQCRKELRFPLDAYIIAFVGAFSDRKGLMRLSSAIGRLKDISVRSIFIGEGDQHPSCEGVLFEGKLPHCDIPKYLNAADVFVLPTLREGCCNAVVEALSCGLPVISSNLPFNWNILNEKNSILVDPMDIDGLASAISEMSDPVKRKEYGENALSSVADLSIDRRASLITDFIRSKL